MDLVVDMSVYNPFDFFTEESAEQWPFDYPEDLHDDLVIYRKPEPVGPRLQAFLDTITPGSLTTVSYDGLQGLLLDVMSYKMQQLCFEGSGIPEMKSPSSLRRCE